MIIRYVEYCPRCGQQDPWRKRGPRPNQEGKSCVVDGTRVRVVFCRRCGFRSAIRYVERPQR